MDNEVVFEGNKVVGADEVEVIRVGVSRSGPRLEQTTNHNDHSGQPVPQWTLTSDSVVYVPPGYQLDVVSASPVEIHLRKVE